MQKVCVHKEHPCFKLPGGTVMERPTLVWVLGAVILLTLLLALRTPQPPSPQPEGNPEAPPAAIVDVRCGNPDGCWNLIEKAILDAPPGALIRVGAGKYHEKPFVIEKPLRLEGVNNPEIDFADPGTGITVRLPQARREPMRVVLQGVRISVPRTPRDPMYRPDEYGGIAIEGHSGLLDVVLDRVSVQGSMGVTVIDARLSMKSSSIDATIVGLEGRYSEVEIRDSRIRVEAFDEANPIKYGLPPGGLGFQSSVAVLEGNRIEGGFVGILLGIEDRVTAVENLISKSVIGAYITDDAIVELTANRFIDNVRYGVALPHGDCVPRPSVFSGEIRGANNEFRGNGQDLCPEDYPWPGNFRAPGDGDS